MAINFFPTSFQDSKTAPDGLATGFGGVVFLASCARAGMAASITATSRAPHVLALFIVSLLVFVSVFAQDGTRSRGCFEPVRAGPPSLTGRPAKCFSALLAKPVPLAGFILRRTSLHVMENPCG